MMVIKGKIMRKQNLENLKEIVNKSNMEIIKVEGKLIHLVSKDGFKYSVNKYKAMSCGTTTAHKFRNTNIYKFYNMGLELKNNNPYGSKIIYSSYNESSRNKMKFVCGNCKKDFHSTIGTFLSSKYRVCEECYHSVQNTKLLDTKDIKKELDSLGFLLLDEKFLGYQNKINIEDKDGYKGNVYYKTIKDNGSFGKFAKYNKYAIENLKLYFNKNGINCTIPEQKYMGWDLPITLICECGNKFITTVSNIIHRDKVQCNDCSGSKSNNEKIVENWLKLNSITYKCQYSFSDCLSENLKRLYFDFYLEGIGLLEVDGEGHFEPVRFNGINIEKAEINFKESLKRDYIKNEYCIKNNIKLLRISYIDINNGNYKKILSSFIFA